MIFWIWLWGMVGFLSVTAVLTGLSFARKENSDTDILIGSTICCMASVFWPLALIVVPLAVAGYRLGSNTKE